MAVFQMLSFLRVRGENTSRKRKRERSPSGVQSVTEERQTHLQLWTHPLPLG